MTAEPGEDLAALPAHRLAASIAAGELTSAELTADCLARIRATDAKLHAFIAVGSSSRIRLGWIASERPSSRNST